MKHKLLITLTKLKNLFTWGEIQTAEIHTIQNCLSKYVISDEIILPMWLEIPLSPCTLLSATYSTRYSEYVTIPSISTHYPDTALDVGITCRNVFSHYQGTKGSCWYWNKLFAVLFIFVYQIVLKQISCWLCSNQCITE